eukprot:4242495-Prymnesium_polylepis.1
MITGRSPAQKREIEARMMPSVVEGLSSSPPLSDATIVPATIAQHESTRPKLYFLRSIRKEKIIVAIGVDALIT